MKKILYIVLLMPLVAFAQTTTENYVKSTTYKVKTTNGTAKTTGGSITNQEKQVSINYFDGLGRAKQSIILGAGGNKEDIITHFEYDQFGRQVKDYLPYANGSYSQNIRTGNIESAIQSFYKSKYPDDFLNTVTADVNAYSEKTLENSPVNRVFEQGAPGKDWNIGTTFAAKGYSNNSHTIKFEYDTNTTNEVKSYGVTTIFANNTYTPTLQGGTTDYLAGELTKTITKDENWESADGVNHTTEEFKNKQGQVILKRTYNNNQPHDTYYVYDDFGNLTYVLPPKAEADIDRPTANELNDLSYQYKYDARNRLVEKKIPGKGWEHIVYNRIDQPILTQDEIQRNKSTKEWITTKYDALGRVIYTSIVTDNQPRPTMQGHANNSFYSNIEERTNTSRQLDGTTIYYTGSTLKGNDAATVELLNINYYDSYIDLPTGLGTTVTTTYGVSSTTRMQGLSAVSKVKVLDTNDWVTTVTYYDEKARPIYIYSKNDYLNTIDILESKLDDFTGKVLETKSTHKKTGKADIVTIDKFDYDHVNRLTKQTEKINSLAEQVIVANTYDELGQLKSKRVGGKTTDTNGLQTVNYKYNVRGWLKNINQDTNNNDNDLFNFTLKYNDIADVSKKLFNGNISQTSWNTLSSDTSTKTYSYSYDALNRITRATGANNHYDLNSVSYDKNGNITALSRNGHTNLGATTFGLMDNLTYSYDSGNKLTKVQDIGNTTYGFKDGANTTTEYTYDANGNMLKDYNKGITTDIQYNHLNLPTTVALGGGTITYIYDATGAKQRKIVSTGTTTDYAGNFVYENNVLQFFNHPEGYVKNDNGVFSYVYQYKDHLGNIRLSYTDANNNGTIEASSEIIEEKNYYPFGLEHKGYNNIVSSNGNSTAQKRKFEGVEFEEALGYDSYEMDFRHYDPALGRFNVIDPMAESRDWLTPYNFVQNNPILRVDPTGLLDDYGVDNVGNVELIKKTDDDTDSLYSVTRGEDGELVKDGNGEVVKNDVGNDGDSKNDSVTINKNKDGSSMLSDLSNSSIITVPGSQKNDLFNVFGFLADNSIVEWSVIKYELMPDSPDYQLGTFRNDYNSPKLTGYRSKGKWLGMVHSHPNQPTDRDRLESVFGDNDVGTKYLTKYGANKPYLIYFPNNKTTSKIGLGKPSFGKRTAKHTHNLKSFKF